MALYAIRTAGDGHRVLKLDEDHSTIVEYHVKGDSCSCPARYGCKHPSMVEDFEALGQIDLGVWNSETEMFERQS